MSVVVPTWNRAEFLQEALESALDQRGAAFEIVVVDDGSEDTTPQVLEALGGRVRALRQAHGGVARARNAALGAACGDLVAFLDSDDLWYPGKLAAQVAVFDAHPEVGLVFTDYEVHDRNGADWERVQVRRYRGPTDQEALLGRNFIGTSTVMVRRACLDRVGGFDEGLVRGSDYEMWLRIARVSVLRGIPHTLACYRRHAESLTGLDPARDDRTRDEVLERVHAAAGRGPKADEAASARPQPSGTQP